MKATWVTASLAERNGSLLPGLWLDSLHITCGLTACTPGSAPGPTLGNEYGKTFTFLYVVDHGALRYFVTTPSVRCKQTRRSALLSFRHLRTIQNTRAHGRELHDDGTAGYPRDGLRGNTVVKKGKGSPYSITERMVPELIPVLSSQPAVINPAVGCHYFPPGLQLPPQPLRVLLPVLLLGERRHRGYEQFA